MLKRPNGNCPERASRMLLIPKSLNGKYPWPLVCDDCSTQGYVPTDLVSYSCEGYKVRRGCRALDARDINNKKTKEKSGQAYRSVLLVKNASKSY